MLAHQRRSTAHFHDRVRFAKRRGREVHIRCFAGMRAGRHGQLVTVIDADPNRPVSRWAERPGKPATLTVIEDVTEDTILGTIKRASEKSAFVIVDLEGTASMTVAYAISRADLVIIPSQGSHLDAEQAAKAVRLVRKQEEAFNLSIPMVVLFTRTSAAIRTRDLKRIEGNFAKAGVAVFNVDLLNARLIVRYSHMAEYYPP